jgi:hypothetical protein
MTTKIFPRTLIAVEAVLLFLLGILGSRMSNWLDLPPSVLIFSSVTLLGALTAVTYAKMNYDPTKGILNISLVSRLLRLFSGSAVNEKLVKTTKQRSGGGVAGHNLFEPPFAANPIAASDEQFDSAFRKAIYRSLVATVVWSIALCKAIEDLSRFLLWLAVFAAIAFISSWPLIALPSGAKGGERLYEILGIPFVVGAMFMIVPALIVFIALGLLGLLPQ